MSADKYFTITAEIHVRSLANFYCQYADRHMNLKFMRHVSEREPAIRQFVIVKNKLLSPRGSTATLTMWWRNSWSITRQTHKKLTSITVNSSRFPRQMEAIVYLDSMEKMIRTVKDERQLCLSNFGLFWSRMRVYYYLPTPPASPLHCAPLWTVLLLTQSLK